MENRKNPEINRIRTFFLGRSLQLTAWLTVAKTCAERLMTA